MKVLVTGSNGMLGSSLLKSLSYDTIGFTSSELDIINLRQCLDIVEKEKPNIVIHAAAYTNVEDSEINPDKAYQVNTIGTQNLVNCCIDKDILFIYISSAGIYGTGKENKHYNEFDKINPTTIYHKSKYEAEKIVQNHLSKFLIVRTGWLFGGSLEHSKNFVYQRYLEAKKNDVINSNASQIGNPTYTKDLIKQIELLIDNKHYGIFNCVNHASNISRYSYVKKIVELLEVDCKVKKVSKDMFKRVAPASNNESAENYKLELLQINQMREWDIALKEYIDFLKVEINEK